METENFTPVNLPSWEHSLSAHTPIKSSDGKEISWKLSPRGTIQFNIENSVRINQADSALWPTADTQGNISREFCQFTTAKEFSDLFTFKKIEKGSSSFGESPFTEIYQETDNAYIQRLRNIIQSIKKAVQEGGNLELIKLQDVPLNNIGNFNFINELKAELKASSPEKPEKWQIICDNSLQIKNPENKDLTVLTLFNSEKLTVDLTSTNIADKIKKETLKKIRSTNQSLLPPFECVVFENKNDGSMFLSININSTTTDTIDVECQINFFAALTEWICQQVDSRIKIKIGGNWNVDISTDTVLKTSLKYGGNLNKEKPASIQIHSLENSAAIAINTNDKQIQQALKTDFFVEMEIKMEGPCVPKFVPSDENKIWKDVTAISNLNQRAQPLTKELSELRDAAKRKNIEFESAVLEPFTLEAPPQQSQNDDIFGFYTPPLSPSSVSGNASFSTVSSTVAHKPNNDRAKASVDHISLKLSDHEPLLGRDGKEVIFNIGSLRVFTKYYAQCNLALKDSQPEKAYSDLRNISFNTGLLPESLINNINIQQANQIEGFTTRSANAINSFGGEGMYPYIYTEEESSYKNRLTHIATNIKKFIESDSRADNLELFKIQEAPYMAADKGVNYEKFFCDKLNSELPAHWGIAAKDLAEKSFITPMRDSAGRCKNFGNLTIYNKNKLKVNKKFTDALKNELSKINAPVAYRNEVIVFERIGEPGKYVISINVHNDRDSVNQANNKNAIAHLFNTTKLFLQTNKINSKNVEITISGDWNYDFSQNASSSLDKSYYVQGPSEASSYSSSLNPSTKATFPHISLETRRLDYFAVNSNDSTSKPMNSSVNVLKDLNSRNFSPAVNKANKITAADSLRKNPPKSTADSVALGKSSVPTTSASSNNPFSHKPQISSPIPDNKGGRANVNVSATQSAPVAQTTDSKLPLSRCTPLLRSDGKEATFNISGCTNIITKIYRENSCENLIGLEFEVPLSVEAIKTPDLNIFDKGNPVEEEDDYGNTVYAVFYVEKVNLHYLRLTTLAENIGNFLQLDKNAATLELMKLQEVPCEFDQQNNALTFKQNNVFYQALKKKLPNTQKWGIAGEAFNNSPISATFAPTGEVKQYGNMTIYNKEKLRVRSDLTSICFNQIKKSAQNRILNFSEIVIFERINSGSMSSKPNYVISVNLGRKLNHEEGFHLDLLNIINDLKVRISQSGEKVEVAISGDFGKSLFHNNASVVEKEEMWVQASATPEHYTGEYLPVTETLNIRNINTNYFISSKNNLTGVSQLNPAQPLKIGQNNYVPVKSSNLNHPFSVSEAFSAESSSSSENEEDIFSPGLAGSKPVSPSTLNIPKSKNQQDVLGIFNKNFVENMHKQGVNLNNFLRQDSLQWSDKQNCWEAEILGELSSSTKTKKAVSKKEVVAKARLSIHKIEFFDAKSSKRITEDHLKAAIKSTIENLAAISARTGKKMVIKEFTGTPEEQIAMKKAIIELHDYYQIQNMLNKQRNLTSIVVNGVSLIGIIDKWREEIEELLNEVNDDKLIEFSESEDEETEESAQSSHLEEPFDEEQDSIQEQYLSDDEEFSLSMRKNKKNNSSGLFKSNNSSVSSGESSNEEESVPPNSHSPNL